MFLLGENRNQVRCHLCAATPVPFLPLDDNCTSQLQYRCVGGRGVGLMPYPLLGWFLSVKRYQQHRVRDWFLMNVFDGTPIHRIKIIGTP